MAPTVVVSPDSKSDDWYTDYARANNFAQSFAAMRLDDKTHRDEDPISSPIPSMTK